MIQKILLPKFFVSIVTFTALFTAALFISPQKVSAAMTVTGTAYENDTGAIWLECDGSTQNISVVVNGGSATNTTCHATTGVFSFGSVSMSDGDRVSVFFNTAGGNTDKGVFMILHDDSQTSVDILLNKNEISVLGQGATSFTNTHLGHCNSSTPAGCANVPYSVSGSTLTTEQGTVFTILSGTDYVPGGNSTFGGGYENYGTSDWSTNTATFNSTSTGNSIQSRTQETFYNLTFNGTGGAWTVYAELTVLNDIALTQGSVTGVRNITLEGNISDNGVLNVPGEHLVNIKQISVDSHTCVVSYEGNAYCWGSNSGAKLGDGTNDGVSKTTPIRVLAGEAVVEDQR